ncbi:Lycopene cyclase [Hibiscus syriacus]|uniref:Lycopene cyclase n=2 Tax=Hibiscus syriacus TaxID=106335 RepID=A0A6A2Y5G1_HIBSY|nr:Lycopene cyclase [Hibiscus syriacus]
MQPKEEGSATAGANAGSAAGAASTDETNINNNINSSDAIISFEREEEVNLSDDELEQLKSLDKDFGAQIKPTTEPKLKPLIQRVPSILLHTAEDFVKYFKPRVISIGPIHHGDPDLKQSEQLKLGLAAHFVKNIAVEKKILYNRIKKQIFSLKKCYDPKELEPYDDKKLAWMFFLDGCAILQAILQGDDHAQQIPWSKMNIKNDVLTSVYLDLFVLENQLPHDVLRLLTSTSWKVRVFMESISRFIDNNNVIAPAEMRKQPPSQHQLEEEEREAVHLLDRFRKRLIFKKVERRQPLEKSGCDRIFRTAMKYYNGGGEGWQYQYPQTFRNVTELRNAGIWLKPSSTSCLTDVSFSNVLIRGQLCLPPITVDDSTALKFMNLIAYEMCPDFENDYTVTSYICFLNSLIDNDIDVKELKDAKILYSGLRSDEEVVNLLNKMSTDLVPNPMIYSDVKLQVENHRRNFWISSAMQGYQSINYPMQAFRNYYKDSSSRIFYATVGAIVALLLSALQTYYTMYPVK